MAMPIAPVAGRAISGLKGLGIPYGLAENAATMYGAAGGTPIGTDALVPWGAFTRGPGVGDLGRELWSRANPLIKALYEVPSGKLAFQRGPHGGRAIEEMEGPLQGIAANVLGTERPLPKPSALEYAVGASPFSRLATTVRTLTDTRKGAAAKAANLLTGARVSDVSPTAVDAMLSQEISSRMKELGGKGFTRTYFTEAELKRMPPQQRAQAQELVELQKLLAKKSRLRKQERERASR